MDRRTFLRGLIAAPIVITTPGLLMPVKALRLPSITRWSDELDADQYLVEFGPIQPVKWGGRDYVALPPGGAQESDLIALDLPAGGYEIVTTYVDGKFSAGIIQS